MTDPYIKANPGDPILSEHWNTIQVRMIEALRTHTHLGGDDGKKLGGGGIDPETTLSVKQVDATSALTVRGLNVYDRLTGLGTEKLAVTGGTVSGSLAVTGNVGIGVTSPRARLDIQEAVRGGNHPAAVRGLYITSDFGPEADGVEFRHTNGTQGVGIAYNTLYATGSNADQDLGLKARGNGKVTIRGDLKIGGPSLLSATGRRLLETSATDDWLRVNPSIDYKAIALYGTVAIGEGGLSVGDWTQVPKGALKVTGTIQTEQDLVLGSNAANKRFIVHSRSGTGDFLHITADKADGNWDWANGIVLKRGGGVGIGTTTPQSALHVVSSTNIVARIEAGGTGGWAEVDLYSTYGVANQRNWNLAAQGGGGFAIRLLSDARGTMMTPLYIDTGGTVFASRNLQVQGDLYAANSGLYFTKTDHDHSGIGNTQGYAAIENASNFGALMILGRSTPAGRIVKLWDRLEVNGKIWTSDGRFEGSDLRLKRDITPLEGALEKVLKLRATRFRMLESRDESPRIGLIAQEVEEVFPEVIDEGPNGMKGISYARLVAPLIEAIKAQQQQLEELRAALRATTKETPA
ncbi:tail fiber domain-containing protein [Pyxidicoccus parkwayensis]|uniref:Tail fiber domain-containing protein n=1 Tax=Pyxidicoccus parkwayensis TaxID=2813578 RepID=A0ABX7NWC4_9BACT|nr:tail fiber domain-containing protein [Pyxidicoccus parkwaysis]QSQ23220.1 tail fiber domain-containing protein [Pyxidicoccus parkwaysis]